MLPFLDRKKAVGVIIARRGKQELDGVAAEVHAPNEENDPAMEAAAEDILRAIDQRSILKLASALKNAFQIADRDPHEEEQIIEHKDRGEL